MLAKIIEQKYLGLRRVIDNDYIDTLTDESIEEGAKRMIKLHYGQYIKPDEETE